MAATREGGSCRAHVRGGGLTAVEEGGHRGHLQSGAGQCWAHASGAAKEGGGRGWAGEPAPHNQHQPSSPPHTAGKRKKDYVKDPTDKVAAQNRASRARAKKKLVGKAEGLAVIAKQMAAARKVSAGWIRRGALLSAPCLHSSVAL